MSFKPTHSSNPHRHIYDQKATKFIIVHKQYNKFYQQHDYIQ